MSLIRLRDGEQLHVRVVGRGRPVMLLHGFAMQSLHWLPFALPLAHRYRFILPDLRGFGRSHDVAFNKPDVMRNHAEDVEDVHNYFGIHKVMLGGISMGAYTGLQLNRMGKFDRVGKYLHIDQSPQSRNAGTWDLGLFGRMQQREFQRLRALVREAESYGPQTSYWRLPEDVRRRMRESLADFFCYAFNQPYHRFLAQRLKDYERLMTRLIPVRNWYAYIQCLRAYMDEDYDMRDTLAQIKTPMTVMVGMRSRMYPAAGQIFIRSQVPHARVVRFEKSGHVPMIDEPVKFQWNLAQFLAV